MEFFFFSLWWYWRALGSPGKNATTWATLQPLTSKFLIFSPILFFLLPLPTLTQEGKTTCCLNLTYLSGCCVLSAAGQGRLDGGVSPALTPPTKKKKPHLYLRPARSISFERSLPFPNFPCRHCLWLQRDLTGRQRLGRQGIQVPILDRPLTGYLFWVQFFICHTDTITTPSQRLDEP